MSGVEKGIDGHVILVAGAGSGIGAATARELAARGGRIACLDRDAGHASETARDIRAQGHEAIHLECDVRSDDEVRQAVAKVQDAWSTLHGLVNSVGITGATGIKSHEVPLADFDTVLSVNLRGALVLSRHVLPIMLNNGYGRILHIASIAGKEGNAGMVSYSASKAGLIGMVKTMGKEYAGTGVTINALAPAVIETPLLDGMPQAQIDYMTSKIPMGRLGTLDEVVSIVAWAISPEASFTTAFTYDLSGGRATY